MFQLEYVNSELKVPFLEGPNRYLPNPSGVELSGIDIGKFFSRVFDTRAIVKKAPRMIAGAATGYLMGGGWSGAAAGAVSAAAFKRQAGTSLFQDIYRGGLYGMIGGGVVGAGKVAMGRPEEAGLVGTGYNYVRSTFFGPKPTVQYEKPIGPEPFGVTEKQYPVPAGPQLPTVQTSLPGDIEGGIKSLPNPTEGKSSSMWDTFFEGAKKVLPPALSFGEKALGYMTAQQQAKAAEYGALASRAMNTVGMPTGFNVPGFIDGSIISPGGMPYSGVPSGVPTDIGMSPGFPVRPVGGEPIGGEGEGYVEERPAWVMPVLIGGGAILLITLLK
jgi:hypothetical protein